MMIRQDRGQLYKRVHLTMSKRTLDYLTGWHDERGNDVSVSRALEELVAIATNGELEKVIDDNPVEPEEKTA